MADVPTNVFNLARIDNAEKEAAMEKSGEDPNEGRHDLTQLPGLHVSSTFTPDLLRYLFTTAAYMEQGRHIRQKHKLQKKLEAKKRAEREARLASSGMTEEELKEEEEKKALAAEISATKAKAIEDELSAKNKPKEPAKQVKLGGKMMINTEGDTMTSSETQRLASLVGAGKGAKMKAFFKTEGVTEEITEESLQHDEVITFSGCKNCDYTISTTCTKIFVERCEDFVLRVKGKVITATTEIDACERINVLFFTKVGTLQVERCKKANILVQHKVHFADPAYMVWAGKLTVHL